jgi:hypothetical protein
MIAQRNTEDVFQRRHQPYAEVDNTVTGVTVIGTEVTDYVLAKAN